MKKVALKGLLVVVLFTGGSVALSTAGVKTVNEASAAVKEMEVRKYLTDRGYTILSLNEIQGSENWEAYTILEGRNYLTTVFVEGLEIIGLEDIAL